MTFNEKYDIISFIENREISTIHKRNYTTKRFKSQELFIKVMPVKYYKRQVNKKPGDIQQAHYSDKQRYEAVVSYLALGNMAVVADATGIPHDRLRHWKMQQWWKDIEAQVRNQQRVEVSGKLMRIIEKASRVVEDRLENGDYRINKEGKLLRIPVNAKTAGDILTKSIDKQALLDKIAEKPDTREEAVVDRLESIAKRLVDAAKLRKTPQVIDLTPVTE